MVKVWWDEAPCQLRLWETRELGFPDKVIRNKGGTNLDHRRRACVWNTPISVVLRRSAGGEENIAVVNETG